MIITVTANPLIDRTLRVDSFTPGQIHRTVSIREVAGGKGINVARLLNHLHAPTHAFSFAGGGYGEHLEHLLQQEQIPHTLITTIAPTRFQVSIIDLNKSIHTDVLDQGTRVTPAEAETLYYSLQLFMESHPGIHFLVLSGSAPAGLPLDFYRRLIRLAHRLKVPVCLDSYGDIFEQGLLEQPMMIKPNLAEAEKLMGHKLTRRKAQIAFLHEMQSRGIQLPILTLGDAGALALIDSSAYHFIPPAIHSVSATGSGDAFVAMLTHLLSIGGTVLESLRWATAAGTANALCWEPCGCRLSAIQEILPQVQIKIIT